MVNGKKIQTLMEQKGISGNALAVKVGVTPAMISYMINGFKEPSVAVLARIAKELGCTVDDLIKEVD